MQTQNKNLRKKKQAKSVKPCVKILWTIVVIGLRTFYPHCWPQPILDYSGKLPSLQQLENPQANLASEIYANDGNTLMGKIYAENRVSVDYKDISPASD